jgi:large subunit ribosomal protein L28
MLGLPFYYKRIVLENIMSKVCQVTGKKPITGFKYAIRGIAKKKKGIGLKVTGKTKRRFMPNLVKKRLWLSEENRFITLRLSTAALRTIDKLGLAAVVREMRKQGTVV